MVPPTARAAAFPRVYGQHRPAGFSRCGRFCRGPSRRPVACDGDDLHEQQPRLARSRRTAGGPGVLLVATIRRDGTPRLSPVEPFVLDGELWLSMMLGSRKAADLQRDPRVLVHSIVTGRTATRARSSSAGRPRAT